jgi:hypothetical protein
MIPFAIEKDLGFPVEPPEGGAVDNAVAVSLEWGSEGMFFFWEKATGTFRSLLRIGGKKGFAWVGGHGEGGLVKNVKWLKR